MYKRDVEIQPINTISAPQGTEVELNISASGNPTFLQWTPTNYLSCSDCLNPLLSVQESIAYQLFASNTYGCDDSLQFNVERINDQVFIPNAFTPNNDRINDFFFPRGDFIEKVIHLKIYDRKGALLFQVSNAPANMVSMGWDGTYKNQPLNSSIYIYQIAVLLKNGEELTKNGSIALIK